MLKKPADLVTFLTILLERWHLLPAFCPIQVRLLCMILGGICVLSGIVLWSKAVLGDKGDKDVIYESDISDVRWIVYDLPGNAGWILYFAGLILAFVKRPVFMESESMFPMMIVAILPALFMLLGIVELIDERIHKLDRVLPRLRLFRGFGALTLGGILGTLIALGLLLCGVVTGTRELFCVWLMLAGGILCSVFAGLLLGRYKRKSNVKM